ncbi:type II secretion system F family protein [Lipingzhangella sp. LS1_29]|uniref:Type II secretion system F family protein n=1 Tax=Lipingzhangella rawalii TaxID=2055835 RepID=A0ABU2H6L6_9ACTN|nr:type II secretion system F family protein [Lipingzhangella rawalii]MDS1270953.1 type II secretion system F family protein [Lipingzhangella rawalii]
MPEVALPLLAVCGALVVLLAARGLYLVTESSDLQLRLLPRRRSPVGKDEHVFVLHRITEAIGTVLGGPVLRRVNERQRQGIDNRLAAAGRPDGLNAEQYIRRKVGEVLVWGTLALVLLLNDQGMLALLALLFAGLTDANIQLRIRERQDKIQSQLPDFLDVLAVTVSAGLSFRAALERTTESMPGVLSDEFQIALRQMELGTGRREAFDALRHRNNNEALSKFVTAIQQSEELGAPLSTSLMEISTDIRRQDYQYVRRKAQRVNPRVTAVTAATMLPALFLLLGGALLIGSEIDFGIIAGG